MLCSARNTALTLSRQILISHHAVCGLCQNLLKLSQITCTVMTAIYIFAQKR